ncbi:MAG TPA: GNAT family N-acetyltransferase [Pedococcus sp.]|jgi:ribosomal protein S18 acetylase RimI-like enzyme|uniref:GNAT family N-acetyltransferase n=1 Tax=Pedococcus sp. TaxID=2860345 RepID=UPI002F92D36F
MDIVVRAAVAEDLPALLPLLRGYGEFYGARPDDGGLLAMASAFLADPDREGRQLLAEAGPGELLGFATVLWSWDTTTGARLAVMEDLFVQEGTRGRGVGRRLLDACLALAREHGCAALVWETAPDNERAQRLYDATPAERSTWLAYRLPVS